MNLVNRLKCPFCEKEIFKSLFKKNIQVKNYQTLFINTINPMN